MRLSEKIYLVFYEFSRLILWFALINILWILVNVPFFIVLIQLGLTTDLQNLTVLLPLLSLLLPVLFFPGTYALISSARDFVLEDKTFKTADFFRYYKTGYKKSFMIGMIYTSLLTVLGYLFYLTFRSSFILSAVLVALFIYLSIIVFTLLYLDAHYNMSMRWKIRETMILIAKHPIFALSNFILLIALNYILYSVSLILFVLFGTTLTVYATYYLFIRKLRKIRRNR